MALNIFAMPSSSILLLFSLSLGMSNALPWAGPAKTGAYLADAWSPKPTSVPADLTKLFKRTSVDVDVCGWIGGSSALPALCGSGSSCIHDTIHGVVGCCSTAGPCTAGVYTSCVDKNSPESDLTSGLADNGIQTCTGNSVCYQNQYPGGYSQFSCGASSDATYVDTSFAGQATDLFLQIVYTGINFTPTLAPTTSPTSSPNPTTSPTGSGSNPTSSATSSHSSKDEAGAIAGGTIGGIAALAALAALVFYLFRRYFHPNRKYTRAGPFTSIHTHAATFNPSLTVSSPPSTRQRMAPFSPDDFVSPVSGLPIGNSTEITAGSGSDPSPGPGPIIFPPTYAYAGSSDPHHPYANAPPTPYFPPPRSDASADSHDDRQLRLREEAPLVSEIDDFSRGYHDAIQQRVRDGELDAPSSRGVLPGGIGGSGIGMGVGASLLRENRAEEREARSEAFREQLRIRNEGWSPQALRSTPMHKYGPLATSGNGSDGEEEEEDEPEIPPRSPKRQSQLVLGLASAVGRRSPDDEEGRYTLMDEVVADADDDVPILGNPREPRNRRRSASG